MENIKYEPCKYCHKTMKKVNCAEEEQNIDYAFSIHEFVTFVLWFVSLFKHSYKEKLEKHKFKITCVNKDCIGYLDGCYVNKHIRKFST